MRDPLYYHVVIAQNIGALRQSRQLTQAEVARRADLHRKTVARAEQCEGLSLDTLVRLARAFDLDLLDLLSPAATLAHPTTESQ